MTRLASLLVAFVFVLVVPGMAAAQAPETNAPPGNSAIDEYLETVPSASGNRAPRKPTDPPVATPTLAPEQRVALERRGADGKALANLVEATAPPARARPGQAATTSAPTAPAPTTSAATIVAADEQAPSPLKATLAAAVGPNRGGGLGVFFPVILVASLVGMVALAIARRRPLAP